jgi:hypothetical protein
LTYYILHLYFLKVWLFGPKRKNLCSVKDSLPEVNETKKLLYARSHETLRTSSTWYVYLTTSTTPLNKKNTTRALVFRYFTRWCSG